MTLDQIIEQSHSLYEIDPDEPSSGDDDYTVRTRIANTAINMWENEEGVLWNELWVELSDAADGDKTTTASTYSYDCPSNFKFPGGFVRLSSASSSTYYTVIPVEKAQLYDNVDKHVCWFSGNPQDGYKLNFLDTHDAGLTISYEYYKTADTLSATSDVPEMSDPYMIVWFIVSQLLKGDGQDYEDAFQISINKLREMVARNDQPAFYQESAIEDLDTQFGVGGFGS